MSPVLRRPSFGLPREVAVLTAVSFSVAVGYGIVSPVLSLFARDFGVGRAAAGAVVSAFAVMRLASGLAGGRLVDRLGERKVLASGLGIVAVSSLLAGLAQSYTQLLVLRGAGGVGSAMFTVSALSLLLRVVPADSRGRATSWFQSGFLLGGVSGPAFGGALAAVSLRAPFFVYAATLAVATAVTVIFLSRAEVADTHAGGQAAGQGDGAATARTPLREALRSRAYQAALVVNLGTGWALFGIRASLVPLFVADVLGRGAGTVGLGLLVGSVAQALALWPAGRVADRVGRKPAMLAGGIGASLALALLVVLDTVPGFLISMALYGLAAAALGVAPAAVVGDVVRGRGGTSVAAFQMASDLGAVGGPLVAGWLADEVSYAWAFGVSAAIVAAGAVMSARMPETRPGERVDAGGRTVGR